MKHVRPNFTQLLLHHDNARPPAAVPLWKRLNRWDFKSFHIYPTVQIWHRVIFFPKLKELLKGIQFNSDEEIKAEVKRWFNAQT